MLILNIHYDSITACSTFIGGKLLVGFKHMTDFHPQNTCSVMQLVILEALLYKWEAGFNLVTTTVRPVLRELSSELQTKPLVWSVPSLQLFTLTDVGRESAKNNASLLTSFLNVCQAIVVTVKSWNLRVCFFVAFISILLGDSQCIHFHGAPQRPGISQSSTFFSLIWTLLSLWLQNHTLASHLQKTNWGLGRKNKMAHVGTIRTRPLDTKPRLSLHRGLSLPWLAQKARAQNSHAM